MDIDKLLQDVSPEAPCGEDLEYDPAFVEMERAAHGKPEQQMGDTIIPAEDPNWREVRSKAEELLGRTRDLRVVVQLGRAVLGLEGMVGFTDSLALLKGLLETQWAAVHPQLDPEDDNDPTLRVNTIVTLCDPGTTIKQLRETALVSSRAMGRFSLKDVQIATGKLASSSAPPRRSPSRGRPTPSSKQKSPRPSTTGSSTSRASACPVRVGTRNRAMS